MIAIITNMLSMRLLFVLLAFFCTGTAVAAENTAGNAAESGRINEPAKEQESPWQFEVGASAGRPTPIMLNAGVGYKNLFFRAMGGGWHFRPDEFWIGFRGSFAWKFFRGLPFSIDAGIGNGYAFAKAPNGYHKALNDANHVRYVRSYNYKESLDISAEVRANIYGVFTYIAIPIHYFMKHDEPNIIWQVGYAYGF